MTSKILTVVPLLALSGLFFAAEIVAAGVLFLFFAAVMLWAYLRAAEDIRSSAEKAPESRPAG